MSSEQALDQPTLAAAAPSPSTGFALRAPQSQWEIAWRGFKRDKLAVVGGLIVLLTLVMALTAPVIAPHDPLKQNSKIRLKPIGTSGHVLGTDGNGRDILSRLIYGSRTALLIATVPVVAAAIAGLAMGLIAGYFGGWVDELLMRFTDMFLAFPALILAVAIAASLGRNLRNTMIALATVFWPWYARLVRAQVLSIKEREFVQAAHSIGMTQRRIILRHVLPNAASVIIIQVTLDVGYAVLATSSLSFIGLGAQPPSPEWGTMMATARNYFRDAWWYMAFPGLALTLTVLAFNLLGDGLQDALDPRSGRR